MATLKQAIKTIAAENAPLSDVIGSRFYPWQRAAQDPGAQPYVTYQKVRVDRECAMGTVVQAKASYVLACWAPDPDDAEELATLVRAAFVRFPNGTVAGVEIQAIIPGGETDRAALEAEAGAQMYCTAIEFTIHYVDPY